MGVYFSKKADKYLDKLTKVEKRKIKDGLKELQNNLFLGKKMKRELGNHFT